MVVEVAASKQEGNGGIAKLSIFSREMV